MHWSAFLWNLCYICLRTWFPVFALSVCLSTLFLTQISPLPRQLFLHIQQLPIRDVEDTWSQPKRLFKLLLMLHHNSDSKSYELTIEQTFQQGFCCATLPQLFMGFSSHGWFVSLLRWIIALPTDLHFGLCLNKLCTWILSFWVWFLQKHPRPGLQFPSKYSMDLKQQLPNLPKSIVLLSQKCPWGNLSKHECAHRDYFIEVIHCSFLV